MFKIQSNIQVGAKFKFEVFNATGLQTKASAEFGNLVLDAGLNRMGKGSYFDAVAVGTGNSVPSAGQTALDNQVAYSNQEQGNFSISYQAEPVPCYVLQRRYRFNAGTFSGQNLAEVSMGWVTGSTFNAFNRALIKDSQGQPTTMTLLSDEYLDVICLLHYYPDITDKNQLVGLVDGNNNLIAETQITTRPALLGAFNPPGQYASSWPPPYIFNVVDALVSQNNWMKLLTGDMGTITGEPTGTVLASTSYGSSDPVQLVKDEYVDGSYKRSGKFIIKLNTGNGTIKSMLLKTTLGCYQAQFTPPIVKNNTQVLTIPIELSWGRKEV
ncbi:hypothetical protein [Acinetobacter indicus]|uniref:hypothetical protein n=1 Tax=Acinetobacter indicus TaxID=756892 RepID=UPI0032B39753